MEKKKTVKKTTTNTKSTKSTDKKVSAKAATSKVASSKTKNVSGQKISSRNKNKNKNQSLQTKVKEKELAKKTKVKKVKEKVLDSVEEIEAVVSTDALVELEENIEKEVVVEVEDKKVEKKRKSSDKFNFVDNMADVGLEETVDELELEEFLEYKNIESVPFEQIEQLDREEIVDLDEFDEVIPEITDKVDINARKYFSFENRIVALLVLIVISFFIAGLLIYKSITHGETTATLYDEKSNASYKVCVEDGANNHYYGSDCLNEGMEYVSNITESIPISFEYEMDFNKAVSTKISYYVVSSLKIYRDENGRVLNTMEDVLVERTAHDIFGDDASLEINVDVAFKKYLDYVNSYNSQYGLDGYADLEVVLYIDNGNVIKRVSEVLIPITNQTYNIDVFGTNNRNQSLSVESDSWGSVNTSYAVVGVIFVLFGVIGIIRLTNLVFKVIGTSSMYQRTLSKILKEYDRYIVISRGEYTIDDSKRLVKVTSFSELLDARNTLEKPIVYVKVNNVKSEFYVEDSETIYKYTLKEADVEGK